MSIDGHELLVVVPRWCRFRGEELEEGEPKNDLKTDRSIPEHTMTNNNIGDAHGIEVSTVILITSSESSA